MVEESMNQEPRTEERTVRPAADNFRMVHEVLMRERAMVERSLVVMLSGKGPQIEGIKDKPEVLEMATASLKCGAMIQGGLIELLDRWIPEMETLPQQQAVHNLFAAFAVVIMEVGKSIGSRPDRIIELARYIVRPGVRGSVLDTVAKILAGVDDTADLCADCESRDTCEAYLAGASKCSGKTDSDATNTQPMRSNGGIS